MNTTVWAVIVAAVVPVCVMLGQNWVARRGKKDDMTLARENLLIQREAAVERTRAELAVKTEHDLRECEDMRDSAEGELRAIRAEMDRRDGALHQRGFADADEAFAYIDQTRQREISEWRRMHPPEEKS